MPDNVQTQAKAVVEVHPPEVPSLEEMVSRQATKGFRALSADQLKTINEAAQLLNVSSSVASAALSNLPKDANTQGHILLQAVIRNLDEIYIKSGSDLKVYHREAGKLEKLGDLLSSADPTAKNLGPARERSGELRTDFNRLLSGIRNVLNDLASAPATHQKAAEPEKKPAPRLPNIRYPGLPPRTAYAQGPAVLPKPRSET